MDNYTQCVNGTYFHKDTPAELARILSGLIHTDTRVRVFLGDYNTGREWGEEFETVGYIGRSTGTRPIALLVHNKRSLGGGALLDDHILKLVETRARRVLWQHPNFKPSILTAREAESLRAYMAGERFCK
jgi:hypothetical protein